MPKTVQIGVSNPPNWSRGCLTAILSVLSALFCWLLVGAACVFWIDSRMRIPEEFCTLEDRYYQVFAANAEEWAKEFPATYSEGGTSTMEIYILPDGTNFSVQARYWGTEEGYLMLFKPTLRAPRSSLGAGGYFYTTTGIVPDFGDPEDEITHLSGNFYCYTLHDPG